VLINLEKDEIWVLSEVLADEVPAALVLLPTSPVPCRKVLRSDPTGEKPVSPLIPLIFMPSLSAFLLPTRGDENIDKTTLAAGRFVKSLTLPLRIGRSVTRSRSRINWKHERTGILEFQT
jgi:hypothetical protein